jgi:hypothetical protein
VWTSLRELGDSAAEFSSPLVSPPGAPPKNSSTAALKSLKMPKIGYGDLPKSQYTFRKKIQDIFEKIPNFLLIKLYIYIKEHIFMMSSWNLN